jgi:hypothetical protein
METGKITLTRALTEKKLLDDRITKAINASVFYGFVVGDKRAPKSPRFKTEDDVKTAIIASDSKVNDLISRRNALASAIIASNASTKVKIGGVEMTVAEAIEMKGSIKYLEAQRNAVANALAMMNREAEHNESDLQVQVDILAEAAFGSDKEKDPTVIQNISDSLVKERKFHAVDPLHLAEKLEKLDEQIDNFNSEVDFVLSESNAITMLTL